MEASKGAFSEGGGSEDSLPNTFSLKQGEFTQVKKEIEEGVEYFWRQDQICGFDKDGNRIGTGIPRVKPSYLGDNEYAL